MVVELFTKRNFQFNSFSPHSLSNPSLHTIQHPRTWNAPTLWSGSYLHYAIMRYFFRLFSPFHHQWVPVFLNYPTDCPLSINQLPWKLIFPLPRQRHIWVTIGGHVRRNERRDELSLLCFPPLFDPRLWRACNLTSDAIILGIVKEFEITRFKPCSICSDSSSKLSTKPNIT